MKALIFVLLMAGTSGLLARELQSKPADPFFQKYDAWRAPEAKALLLEKGDRLAICGDSITEQRMYSRIIETFLAVCTPELAVECRQFGWSGEQAGGFLARMKNDVLRFQPTIATTCYGMNDHRYVPFTQEIGDAYRRNQTAVVHRFKEAGVRVVLGSPGTIHSVPPWVRSASGTWEELNLSLLRLRNIDVEIADGEQVAFADVYWPMLTAGFDSRKRHGDGYHLEGGDGVHPGWAGQTVMAFAFLTALGLDGEIGTVTVDWPGAKAESSAGHEVLDFTGGDLRLRSSRLAFCAAGGDPAKADNIRSAMAFLPFNEKLNRFVLRLKNAPDAGASITWGEQTRDYAKAQLESGVNLAADFETNPFKPAFDKVWNAVGAKQEYETRQIKQLFHGPEGAVDMEATAALTEKARARLVEAVKRAVRPVEHVIRMAAK